MKSNEKDILDLYSNGFSMYSIAKHYNINPSDVSKILQQNNVKLRHDVKRKGTDIISSIIIDVFEHLRSHDTQISKQEFCEKLHLKRFNNVYIQRCPEITPYIKFSNAENIQKYEKILYSWLLKNNIPFIPHCKSELNITVTATLKGDYDDVVLQIAIKPNNTIRKGFHETRLNEISKLTEASGKKLILLYEEDFNDLDILKERIHSI